VSAAQTATHPGAAGSVLGRIPPWLAVPAALGALVLVLPFIALLARLDWAGVPAAITSPAALQALSLSLSTASIATVV
jgi:molybdate transport system permease protein